MGVDINWGLGQGNNALAMFQQGAQMGSQIRQQREQTEQRNALLELRKKESEREEQEFAAKQQETASKQQEAERGKIVTMGKLLSRAKDPVTYAQSRAAAQQLGFDVASIPEQYDPNWVAQQSMIVQAFQDGGAERISAEARRFKEAGYSDEEITVKMRELVNRPDYMAIPQGGTLVNTRDPAAVAGLASQGDDEWEVVTPGGAGGNASGGFQP